jgi:hypothetical protein
MTSEGMDIDCHEGKPDIVVIVLCDSAGGSTSAVAAAALSSPSRSGNTLS